MMFYQPMVPRFLRRLQELKKKLAPAKNYWSIAQLMVRVSSQAISKFQEEVGCESLAVAQL